MARVLSILLFTCLLTACGKDSPSGGAIQVNKSELTSTQWCDGDGDQDGSIGTFIFKPDGTGVWAGWKAKTKVYYLASKIRYTLKDDVLTWGWNEDFETYSQALKVRILQTKNGRALEYSLLYTKNYGQTEKGQGEKIRMSACDLPEPKVEE